MHCVSPRTPSLICLPPPCTLRNHPFHCFHSFTAAGGGEQNKYLLSALLHKSIYIFPFPIYTSVKTAPQASVLLRDEAIPWLIVVCGVRSCFSPFTGHTVLSQDPQRKGPVTDPSPLCSFSPAIYLLDRLLYSPHLHLQGLSFSRCLNESPSSCSPVPNVGRHCADKVSPQLAAALRQSAVCFSSPITFYFFKHLLIRRRSADTWPQDETSAVRVMLEVLFMRLLHLGLRMNLLHSKEVTLWQKVCGAALPRDAD